MSRMQVLMKNNTVAAYTRPMSVVLYHHPLSRASGVLWMLEEAAVDYELKYVDIMAGDHKKAAITELNPMGETPDDDGRRPSRHRECSDRSVPSGSLRTGPPSAGHR